VYRIETTTCQSEIIHTKCNHRQVGIEFSATSSFFTINAATWNSYTTTIEFWLYVPATIGSSSTVVSKLSDPTDLYGSANSGGWIVELIAGDAQLRFTTISRSWAYNSAVFTKSTSLTLGAWAHVAIVMDVTSATVADTYNDITFVIDGVDATGLHGTCCAQQSTYSAGTDYLATQSVTTVDHSYGQASVANLYLTDQPIKFGPAVAALKIAGVRIWDTALSAATVSTYMNTCVESTHPNFASLKHDFELDQGSGYTVQDGVLSASDQTGSLDSVLAWWGQVLTAPTSSPSGSPTSSSSSNGTLCDACPFGYYAELEGLSSCTACGTGTNTTTTGTVNATSCV